MVINTQTFTVRSTKLLQINDKTFVGLMGLTHECGQKNKIVSIDKRGKITRVINKSYKLHWFAFPNVG